MLTEFLEKILGMHAAKIEVGDKTFSPVQMYEVRPMVRRPNPLDFMTLTGIVDYLDKVDGEVENVADDQFVSVVSPWLVYLFGKAIPEDGQRTVIATAKASPDIFDFKFGNWYSPEDFIIKAAANFVKAPGLDKITKLVSRVGQATESANVDDGVSQSVSVKSGVVLVSEAKIENPVALIPIRIFPEVEQVAGQFILRIEKDRSDEGPGVALFEVNVGMWKYNAIHSIVNYLREKLPDEMVIG